MTKVAPVSLIDVSIPVQFQITNVMDWAYNNAGPTNLLQDLATRDVVHYLAGVDLNEVLSHGRLEAAQALRRRIQAAANEHRLGAKILFVGVQDIHPPVKVAGDYEKVVGAGQQRIADTNNAGGRRHPHQRAGRRAGVSDVNEAEATRQQTEVSAWCARGAVHQPDSRV